MRRFFLAGAALCAALLLSSVSYAENIRVLIIDEQFGAPDGKEMIKLLDRTDGKLLVSDKPYSGKIEVWKGKKGLYLINEIPIEEYIKSVVKAETGKDWDLEALKVQAVISRTYAVNKKSQTGNMKYDITSSTLHQVYSGDIRDEMVAQAVKETEGEILTYEGKPIEALYHSTCGGHTEDVAEVFGKSLPYLKPVEVKCDLSPLSVWARKIPLSEMEKALGVQGIKNVSIKSYTSTGRVKELEVEDSEGKTLVKATDLRRLLGWRRLPSTAFKLELQGNEVAIEGSGYGHGVGLCQWSALEMAQDGKTYKEILSFFYPGTQISNKIISTNANPRL